MVESVVVDRCFGVVGGVKKEAMTGPRGESVLVHVCGRNSD